MGCNNICSNIRKKYNFQVIIDTNEIKCRLSDKLPSILSKWDFYEWTCLKETLFSFSRFSLGSLSNIPFCVILFSWHFSYYHKEAIISKKKKISESFFRLRMVGGHKKDRKCIFYLDFYWNIRMWFLKNTNGYFENE